MFAVRRQSDLREASTGDPLVVLGRRPLERHEAHR